MKAEGFVPRTVQLYGLYQDMDGEMSMADNDHLPLQAQAYPGHLEDELITVVCGREFNDPIERSGLKPFNAD